MNTVRWNIAVSPDVDQSVRMFIAAHGGGRKGDLSRFIEEAVRLFTGTSCRAGEGRRRRHERNAADRSHRRGRAMGA